MNARERAENNNDSDLTEALNKLKVNKGELSS